VRILEPVAATVPTNVQHRMAFGFAYNFVGSLFSQGSTLVANIIVSRMLGKILFGEYSTVLVTLTAVANFSLLSMSSVVGKYSAEYREKDKELAARAISLCSRISNAVGLIGLVLMAVLAKPVAQYVLKDQGLVTPILIGSLFVFAQNRALFLYALMAGLEEYQPSAMASMWSGVAYVALIVVGAHYNQLLGAVAGLSAAAVVFWICLLWVAIPALKAHGLPKIKKFDAFEKDILLHFAVPAIASGLLLIPGFWWLAAYLYRLYGPGPAAIFSACNSIRVLILFVPMVISTVGNSVLNNTLGTEHYHHARRLMTIGIALFTGAVVAFVVGFGPWVLRIFGDQYSNGYPVLAVMAISTIPEALGIAMRQRINANRLIWSWFFAVVLPWQAVEFASSLWAIPKYGAMGAAISYSAGAVVFALCSWILCLTKVVRHEPVPVSDH
jgi:O-antigen/teichoic acid export membrane protein